MYVVEMRKRAAEPKCVEAGADFLGPNPASATYKLADLKLSVPQFPHLVR